MRNLSEEEILDFVVNSLAKGINHKHYDKTVEVATHWRRVVTGEGQESFILKKKEGDTYLQKQQAIKIFNTPTPYVCSRMKSPFKEVHRTRRVNKVLELKDDSLLENDRWLSMLSQTDRFFKGQSLDEYLDERLLDYSIVDPNAYILIDFFPFNNKTETATTYPLVFASSDVIHKEDDYSGLQFITLRKKVHVAEDENIVVGLTPMTNSVVTDKNAYKYFTYTRNYSYEIIETKLAGKVDFDITEQTIVRDLKVNGTTKQYYINVYIHNSEFVPVHPLGYVKDPLTNYETFESIFIAAKQTIQELIEDKSKLDNHKRLHGFARLITYVRGCNYRDEEGNECENGYINGEVCSSCQGTDIAERKSRTTRSEFEVTEIEIPLPSTGNDEELLDVSKLAHYQEIPKVIIDMIQADVKELEHKTSLAIFNTSIFDINKMSSQTQLEIMNIAKPVNNVIHEYAKHKESVWKFIIDQMSKYNGLYTKINRNLVHDPDYKLESDFETITMINLGKEAGVSLEFIRSLERDLIEKKYQDQSDELLWFDTKNKHRPFYNKSINEKTIELGFLDRKHPKRILYLFFEEIFKDIRSAERVEGVESSYSERFLDLDYQQQKDVIMNYVNKYSDTLEDNEITLPEIEGFE